MDSWSIGWIKAQIVSYDGGCGWPGTDAKTAPEIASLIFQYTAPFEERGAIPPFMKILSWNGESKEILDGWMAEPESGLIQLICITQVIIRLSRTHLFNARFMMGILDKFTSPSRYCKLRWMTILSSMDAATMESLLCVHPDIAVETWGMRIIRYNLDWIGGPFGIEFVQRMIPLVNCTQIVEWCLKNAAMVLLPLDTVKLLETWHDHFHPGYHDEDVSVISETIKDNTTSQIILGIALAREKNHDNSGCSYIAKTNSVAVSVPKENIELLATMRRNMDLMCKTNTTISKLAAMCRTFHGWAPFGDDHEAKTENFNQALKNSLDKRIGIEALSQIIHGFI